MVGKLNILNSGKIFLNSYYLRNTHVQKTILWGWSTLRHGLIQWWTQKFLLSQVFKLSYLVFVSNCSIYCIILPVFIVPSRKTCFALVSIFHYGIIVYKRHIQGCGAYDMGRLSEVAIYVTNIWLCCSAYLG